MASYKEIIELVAKRSIGVFGVEKSKSAFKEAGYDISEAGGISVDAPGIEDLRSIVESLGKSLGVMAVIGSKVSVMNKANEGGVDIQEIEQIFTL